MGVLDNTLEARVQALETELAALRSAARERSRPAPPPDSTVPPTPPDPQVAGPSVSNRRGVVKLLAAGAAGAVAGAALHGQPASAADGDFLELGTVNEASTVTEIHTSNNTALYAAGGGGYGVEAWGASGNALFDASGDSPQGRPAWAGTLIVDDDGNWWAATKSDEDDGLWRKLAGQGTAGALHLLSAPKRVYDSRPGEIPAVDPKAPLAPNVARTIDPKQNSSGVPSEALGVLITLTIPVPSANGFATVWPSGEWPKTSNINFAANQVIATTTVVGLAAGATFQVLSSVTTNVIIDIVGYYV